MDKDKIYKVFEGHYDTVQRQFSLEIYGSGIIFVQSMTDILIADCEDARRYFLAGNRISLLMDENGDAVRIEDVKVVLEGLNIDANSDVVETLETVDLEWKVREGRLAKYIENACAFLIDVDRNLELTAYFIRTLEKNRSFLQVVLDYECTRYLYLSKMVNRY